MTINILQKKQFTLAYGSRLHNVGFRETWQSGAIFIHIQEVGEQEVGQGNAIKPQSLSSSDKLVASCTYLPEEFITSANSATNWQPSVMHQSMRTFSFKPPQMGCIIKL